MHNSMSRVPKYSEPCHRIRRREEGFGFSVYRVAVLLRLLFHLGEEAVHSRGTSNPEWTFSQPTYLPTDLSKVPST